MQSLGGAFYLLTFRNIKTRWLIIFHIKANLSALIVLIKPMGVIEGS